MGKKWPVDLSLWPWCAHEPLVFEELCFHAAHQKRTIVFLGWNFILRGSVQEFWDSFTVFLCHVSFSLKDWCTGNWRWLLIANIKPLGLMKSFERILKRNKGTAIWVQGCRVASHARCWRPWLLKLDMWSWLIVQLKLAKTCGFHW